MAKQYAVYICGPSECPNDPAFMHENALGCVPKDFSLTTGRSKTHWQRKIDGRYRWNGGCDLTPVEEWADPQQAGTQRDGGE